MEQVLPILLTLLLVGSGVYLLWHEHTVEKMLCLRMQKLQASQLFEDMQPFLRMAKKHAFEQLTVDKTGVAIRYLNHSIGEVAFLMRPNGYHYLTPEQQEAMRGVLEELFPVLRDHAHYGLNRCRNRLLNGDVEYAYRYIIANAYKAKLVRAPYYDGSLQSRLW